MIAYIPPFLLGIWLLWAIWSKSGRTIHEPQADLNLQAVQSFGTNSGSGNLLGVQPYMVPLDYASQDRFYAKLAGYLEIARRERWLGEKTVVIFPEYLSTWLVAAGEKRSVFQAGGIERAMQILVLSNLFSFIRVLLKAWRRPHPQDLVKYSLFRLKADRMAHIYQAVFARLARDYAVTIVAGSILLPSPRIDRGKLTFGAGALLNVSMVFRPDGTAHDRLVRKAFPIEDELPFTSPAPDTQTPIFETPAGRLAVLICADSWYPAAYQRVALEKPDLIAVPSYLTGDDVWTKPWQGYNGAPLPADVDPGDIGRLTEGEAWKKYALPGRIGSTGARYGMNVFMHGTIWDLGSDGQTLVMREKNLAETGLTKGAALTNCWIN